MPFIRDTETARSRLGAVRLEIDLNAGHAGSCSAGTVKCTHEDFVHASLCSLGAASTERSGGG